MIIEVDDDYADIVVQNCLVRDYVSLTRDLKTPDNMHEEDVIAYKETVVALAALGKWYFAHGEFKKAVNKARKFK